MRSPTVIPRGMSGPGVFAHLREEMFLIFGQYIQIFLGRMYTLPVGI